MWTLLFLISSIFFITILSQSSKSGVGPFQVKFIHAEECKDIGRGRIRWLPKMKKFNRTAYSFNCDSYLGIPLSDDITVSLSTAVFTNGGYKENFWSKDFPKFCTTMMTLIPEEFRTLAKAANLPGKGCPIPAGNYSLKNMPATFDVPGIPAFFYNKYRMTIVLLKASMRESCVNILVEVLPKKKNKGKKI